MKEKIVFEELNYVVHLSKRHSTINTIQFDIYPFQGDKSDMRYYSKSSTCGETQAFKEDECTIKMSGTYCWRGVWEGRLYFPDDEYWSDELSELNTIFDIVEEYIKETNKW